MTDSEILSRPRFELFPTKGLRSRPTISPKMRRWP
jgi:hypothetical protein